MKNIETKWKSSDNLEIHAQAWIPDDKPAKAVVCLVHGIGEHILRYRKTAEVLTKEGFVLFGADMRGHGKSGGKRGHFPSISAIHSDIDKVLSNARKLFPGLPVFLYGHSLGGILVLHYTLIAKPEVIGVISTSPGLRNAIEKQRVKVMAAKLLGSLVPGLTIPTGLDPKMLSRDPKVVEEYKNDPLVHDKMSTGFGKIMLKVNADTLKQAAVFPKPLLLMHGKNDEIAFPSGSIEFASPLGDKCNLVLWDDAWHELHNEPIRGEVIKTMTNWMENRLS